MKFSKLGVMAFAILTLGAVAAGMTNSASAEGKPENPGAEGLERAEEAKQKGIEQKGIHHGERDQRAAEREPGKSDDAPKGKDDNNREKKKSKPKKNK